MDRRIERRNDIPASLAGVLASILAESTLIGLCNEGPTVLVASFAAARLPPPGEADSDFVFALRFFGVAAIETRLVEDGVVTTPKLGEVGGTVRRLAGDPSVVSLEGDRFVDPAERPPYRLRLWQQTSRAMFEITFDFISVEARDGSGASASLRDLAAERRRWWIAFNNGDPRANLPTYPWRQTPVCLQLPPTV